MLIAGATSKQVIIEQTSTSVDSSTEIQHGTWMVAYDNLNFHKKVFHKRVGRHDESRDFTSRLAIKVHRLPPETLLCTALEPHNLLPTVHQVMINISGSS